MVVGRGCPGSGVVFWLGAKLTAAVHVRHRNTLRRRKTKSLHTFPLLQLQHMRT